MATTDKNKTFYLRKKYNISSLGVKPYLIAPPYFARNADIQERRRKIRVHILIKNKIGPQNVFTLIS